MATVNNSLQHHPYARVSLWIFISFSIFYISITRGHFIGTDEIAVFQTARSLWEQGNLSTGYIVNTFSGRDGMQYAQYNAGQSIAALPLYGLGKAAKTFLMSHGGKDWIDTFAGPSIGEEPSRWGGDIEIFFVNLFNCFVTALLCAVFFAVSFRLGCSVKWAFRATILLGLTTFVGPFSTGFLQHSSEALFLLWTFYLLFLNARLPVLKQTFWAGVLAGLMILFRFPSIVALPGLGIYLIVTLWENRDRDRRFSSFLFRAFPGAVCFLVPIGACLGLHFAINYIKFQTIWGKYNNEGFHTPLLKGLFAFFFSPGDSIFLFSPLLLLVPWMFRHFMKTYKTETLVIFFLAATYLVFYGTYTSWHGLWSSLGPRYLVPVIPLLLLPMGLWMQRVNRKGLMMVIFLAAIGFWIQLLHVAVNFAFVYHFEKYPDYQPAYSFLFIPDGSPIAAFQKAFFAADYRVDMWLINVYRMFGLGRLMTIAIPLFTLLAFCIWRLWQSLQVAQAAYAKEGLNTMEAISANTPNIIRKVL